MDWAEGSSALQAEIPVRVAELQVVGDQLADGTVLVFDRKNQDYRVSLLQAMTLLLRGPIDSQLQKSHCGPQYVQMSWAAFRSFSQAVMEMRALAASA